MEPGTTLIGSQVGEEPLACLTEEVADCGLSGVSEGRVPDVMGKRSYRNDCPGLCPIQYPLGRQPSAPDCDQGKPPR